MRLWGIFFILVSMSAQAQTFRLILTNAPLTATFDESSYDTFPLVMSGRYFRSYFDGMYPANTNHILSVSSSGQNWGGQWQALQEKRYLPLWASVTNLIWDFKLANDNSGLSSNQVYQYGTNLDNAPGLFWNGTAVTNEGGKAALLHVSHLTLGAIPAQAVDGNSGQIPRQDACTNLNILELTPIVNTWSFTWNVGPPNGWTNGILGYEPAPFSSGHPLPPGHLEMAFSYWIQLGADTNVGAMTVDYSTQRIVSTNRCVLGTPSFSGSVLSWLVHYDRMPPGWDVPDDIVTNDCRPLFGVYPALGNAFLWTVAVTNLPPGNWNSFVDGTPVDTATAAQWAAGRNWFTNYNGPLWKQRRAVQFSIDDLYGVDHTSLVATHNAGSVGVLGAPDLINYNSLSDNSYDTMGLRGDAYITAMATAITGLQVYDTAIHAAAVQINHTFSISQVPQFPAAPFRP